MDIRTRNNEAVKKYTATKDCINLKLPKGTKERIQALGYTPTTFCRDIVLNEIEKLEKIKKSY